MKTRTIPYLSIATVYTAILTPIGFGEYFSFATSGQEFAENFNTYRGTLETLPTFFSVSWDEGRTEDPFTGVGDFFSTDPELGYGGFVAYTADNQDFSFGIREREPVDLRDARLFFAFRNDTGAPIRGFWVSYDVESWYRGDRLNRIRLKYDVVREHNERDTFETDIFSTDNPGESASPDTKQNGSFPENRIRVSEYVDLEELEIIPGDEEWGTFGALPPGATAYFRWQFSNLATGESGSLRSGLAINNLSIIPDGESVCPEPGHATLATLGVVENLGSCWAIWYGDDDTDPLGAVYLRYLDESGAGWMYHLGTGWLYVVSGGSFAGDQLYLISREDEVRIAGSVFSGSFFDYSNESFVHWVPIP